MLAPILTAPAMSISPIQRSHCEVSCVEVIETVVYVLMVSFEAMASYIEEKCSKTTFVRNMAFTHVPGSHTYFLMVSAKAIDVSVVYCEGPVVEIVTFLCV